MGEINPLLLTEGDVARCLTMAELIPLMRATLAAYSSGRARQPVRTNLTIRPAGGFYGVMPAHLPSTDGNGVFGLKSVSFFPGNERLQLPTHLATILLLDDRTGALAAILDGRLITEMRTAAVSAVSVELLARPDAVRLAILGSGVQARSHLEALALVRPLSSVTVWSRTRAHAERFAREMAGRCAAPVALAASAREAVATADIVVTAMSSSEPVLEGPWVRPGSHLCVVGSSHPRMREVDTDTVLRSRVFVDSRAGAAAEAGDLLIPVDEGRWSLERIVAELGEVAGGAAGRTAPEQITLFKSLGMAVEDLASAELAVRRARAQGLGREIAL